VPLLLLFAVLNTTMSPKTCIHFGHVVHVGRTKGDDYTSKVETAEKRGVKRERKRLKGQAKDKDKANTRQGQRFENKTGQGKARHKIRQRKISKNEKDQD
jgi:hypothetical protein